MTAFEETEKMKNLPTTGWAEKQRAWGRDKVKRTRTCCNCGTVLPPDPPGPPAPPPWSCGKLECNKKRQRRIVKIFG